VTKQRLDSHRIIHHRGKVQYCEQFPNQIAVRYRDFQRRDPTKPLDVVVLFHHTLCPGTNALPQALTVADSSVRMRLQAIGCRTSSVRNAWPVRLGIIRGGGLNYTCRRVGELFYDNQTLSLQILCNY
jgi:hypothetical protein